MTRGILIAGNESSLFSAVAAEAVKRVESFVSVLIQNRLSMPEGGGGIPSGAEPTAGAISLSWNPGSSISARTLVLAAENRLEKINDAIIVCSPPAVFKTAEALTPEEVEILANDHVKGWFFLVRELALYFHRAGTGSLSFVAPEIIPGGGNKIVSGMPAREKNALNRSPQVDLLGPSAAASFRAFAQGILASSANEPFQAMGFSTAEAGAAEGFAPWLFKKIDEGAGKNSGRWHKYSRFRLFR